MIETRVACGMHARLWPGQFSSRQTRALALITELGLGGEVIASNDHQRTTYICYDRLIRCRKAAMMMVPSRVMPMAKSPLLSWEPSCGWRRYFRSPVTP
jgi:hypothetical protein